jgi:hypothetical protein
MRLLIHYLNMFPSPWFPCYAVIAPLSLDLSGMLGV